MNGSRREKGERDHCGLERLLFSGGLCRRCGAPKPAGAPGALVAAAQVPRRNRKRGTRPAPTPPTPPEVNLAKILDGFKDNGHFKDSEALAAMQAKAEQAWEADKLAKRQARTPEVAVQSAFSALQSCKATLAKSQTKITELEAAAKAAAEAVDEAKQKAEKLQGELDKLQTEYDEEVARLVKPSDRVTHLRNTVREAFQASHFTAGNGFAGGGHTPHRRRPMCATSTCSRTKRRPS